MPENTMPAPEMEAPKLIKLHTEVPEGMKEKTFHFRENSKTGIKRPSVTVLVPEVTIDLLIEAINDEDAKLGEWVVEQIQESLEVQARKQIDASESSNSTDLEALTIEKMAYTPKSTRGAFPKELWEDFKKDYVHVMVDKLGMDQAKVETALSFLVKKLTPVAERKEVVEILLDLVHTWYGETELGAELAPVYEYLVSRSDTLLTREEADLASLLT